MVLGASSTQAIKQDFLGKVYWGVVLEGERRDRWFELGISWEMAMVAVAVAVDEFLE